MKLRIIELAMFMFLMMSVVFLSQTQDVVGHDRQGDDGKAHADSAHNHKASIQVNSDGNLMSSGATGGEDPRGNLYNGSSSETCGTTSCQTAWGKRWYGGTFSWISANPDNDRQQCYYITVTAEATAGENAARLTVTPGIDLIDFVAFPSNPNNPENRTISWQGSARGTVRFNRVEYHKKKIFQSGCGEVVLQKEKWTDTGFFDLIVKNERRAPRYRFLLFLSTQEKHAKFQKKVAKGKGRLNGDDVKSGEALAEYTYNNWRVPCHDFCTNQSKTPKD